MPRGAIEKRGPNQYRVRVYLRSHQEGKRHYRHTTVHGTRGDAEKRLKEMLRETGEER